MGWGGPKVPGPRPVLKREKITVAPMITERVEDYLETIYLVVKRKGYAKVKDVAHQRDLSYASVTGMFQKLSEEGYVNYEKYSGVTLTEKGKEIAKSIYKRHKDLKRFLVFLGVPEEISESDACELEHVVHPETMKRLMKLMSFIQQHEEWKQILDHFEHYVTTGRFIESKKICPDDCPIHTKKND